MKTREMSDAKTCFVNKEIESLYRAFEAEDEYQFHKYCAERYDARKDSQRAMSQRAQMKECECRKKEHMKRFYSTRRKRILEEVKKLMNTAVNSTISYKDPQGNIKEEIRTTEDILILNGVKIPIDLSKFSVIPDFLLYLCEEHKTEEDGYKKKVTTYCYWTIDFTELFEGRTRCIVQ